MCNDVLNLFHGLEFLLGLVIVLNEAGHLLLHPVRELDILSLLLLLLLPLSCLFPVVAGFAVTHPGWGSTELRMQLSRCRFNTLAFAAAGSPTTWDSRFHTPQISKLKQSCVSMT